MVKIKLPKRMENSSVKVGALFSALFRAEASRKIVFDERMVLDLKKGGSVVVFEKDGVSEVYKNSHGRSKLTQLKKYESNNKQLPDQTIDSS